MDLLWLFQPRSQRSGISRLCLGLLVVLLASGLLLNTLLDVDCLRIQTPTCCCNENSPTQDTELQPDTCTHCTCWLPVFLSDGMSEVSMVDLPFHNLIGRTSSVLHLERPPIFA